MKNKLNFNKLRNRIWLYFVVFTVLLVCLIWLLQTVFFEYNYQRVRGETMNLYADMIVSDIKDGKPLDDEYVLTLRESGIETITVRLQNGEIKEVYPSEFFSATSDENKQAVTKIIDKLTLEDKNSASGEISILSNSIVFYTVRRLNFNEYSDYVFLFSSMNSVKDTVLVLRNQLFLVAVIVTLISLFISFVIADRISRPIGDMSAVAERWAKGDESVLFESGTYAEMEELANALNKAKAEVNKSTKLQKDLLANVTHDLKTPLTMIKAYAEMIKDISGENKEKRDKHTQVIIDEADRLTLLVNDILSLSKLQSQAESVKLKPFDLSTLIETVVYRFEAFMAGKGYKILSEITPNVYVNCDEKKIEEVIYNLIGNAINYTGEDKTVKVFLTVNDNRAVFEILDSGLGINDENIKTIWEKYYRYSESHKRAIKGTGLGLSIVKAILDAHELEYGVLSKENVGSNFYVVFEKLSDKEVENIYE